MSLVPPPPKLLDFALALLFLGGNDGSVSCCASWNKHIPGRRDTKPNHHPGQEEQGECEIQQLGKNGHQWHQNSGEIYLCEKVHPLNEAVGGTGERLEK